MDFLHIDLKFVTLDTFLVQFVLLLTILWVLNKFVIKPYIEYIDEEAGKKEKLETDYNNINKLIEDAKKESEEIINEAKKKANNMIDEGQEQGKRKRDSIIEKAETDAKNMVDQAKTEVEKERLGMMNSVKSKLVDLVLKLGEKILSKDSVNKDFIEKQIAEIKV